MTVPVLLRGATTAGGEAVDVLTDPRSGLVADVAPAGTLPVPDGAELVDCAGMMLLPAPAEPHAHLDKALSADAAPNPAGDLHGAIAAWHAYWPQLTEEEILGRARRAAHELVAHGTTAIRSHADVSSVLGTRAVRALAALREELRAEGLAELQVVALCAPPQPGDDPDAYREQVLNDALDAGADVCGGVPHLDADPRLATGVAFAVARARGVPIDLHTDEQLDASVLALPELIRLVAEAGFAHGACASHCVSLGMQDAETQRAIAEAAAAAPVAIVTLPQTNLYLQARGIGTAPPRGLTAVRALLDAGAVLAAGADNVRDPFNCVGRSDALETAALLVMAAHLTPAEAWHAVSTAARTAMGLPAGGVEPGAPAELLAVRGTSLADALARASEHRVVVHRGRVVARTHVTGRLSPLSAPTPAPA